MATETRTANEAAALRAAAGEVAGRSAYETEVARAVVATLDWLEGATDLAPVTGEPVTPTADTVVRERLRAEDAEQRALRGQVDGTYAGVVGQTLSWWTRRAFTEAPL